MPSSGPDVVDEDFDHPAGSDETAGDEIRLAGNAQALRRRFGQHVAVVGIDAAADGKFSVWPSTTNCQAVAAPALV